MLSRLKTILSRRISLIVIVAALLRLVALGSTPPSLNWDEVSMGYTAYSIGKTGMDEWGEKLPLFFRSYGEWKSAVYIYTLVPFIRLFGLNEIAVRLPSAISGILAVFFTYLIGRKLYSVRVGEWAAFFLAVSPWHLMLSRPAFEANFSLTLILAGTALFLSDRNWRTYASSALFLALALHTYNSAKIFAPLLAIWLLYTGRRNLSKTKVLAFLTVFLIFAFPIFANLVSGKSQFRYTQVGITTDLNAVNEFIDYRRTFPLPPFVNKLLFNRYTLFAYQFVDNWLSYFSPSFLLTSGGDHNQHSIPLRGVLYFVEFLFVILGLRKISASTSPLKWIPIFFIAVGFFAPATTRDTNHVLRSILTLPGWQLLAGLGAVSLVTLRPFSPKLFKFIVSVFILEVSTFLFMYFAWYPRAFARDWQWGYKQVAEYLEENESSYKRIVFTKWFGEPQLFLAFYNAWDPTLFRKENLANLSYEREGKLWLDQLNEYGIGKYTFKYLNWQTEEKKDTLFIGKFDDFYTDSNYLKTIYYPDGSVAFHIVKGE